MNNRTTFINNVKYFAVIIDCSTKDDVTQPFTWSSEYADEELALIYYNYRHYNPTDGRWINRDPIGEQGGVNLYAFVRNNNVIYSDYIGLWFSCLSSIAQQKYCEFLYNQEKEWRDYIDNYIYREDSEGNLILNPRFKASDFDQMKAFKDQINPLRQGDTSRNYLAWILYRLPKTINIALKEIRKSVERRIRLLCGKKANYIDQNSIREIGFGIRPENIKKYGDTEYSLWERYAQIGSFNMYIKNVSISWDESNNAYAWQGTAYAVENAGATNPKEEKANIGDYILYYMPYFAKARKITFAEIPINGKVACCRQNNNNR